MQPRLAGTTDAPASTSRAGRDDSMLQLTPVLGKWRQEDPKISLGMW